ncbi:hypothetical protein EFP22_13170 [Lacticaseibacillus paracasei]|nr:hypothetical protein [Lacticaseibacillus paracasei]
MQWTDEQISGIRKLASEGFTRRETAYKLVILTISDGRTAKRLSFYYVIGRWIRWPWYHERSASRSIIAKSGRRRVLPTLPVSVDCVSAA